MGGACQRRTSTRGTRTVTATVIPTLGLHKERCGGKALAHLPKEAGVHGM